MLSQGFFFLLWPDYLDLHCLGYKKNTYKKQKQTKKIRLDIFGHSYPCVEKER